MNLVFSSLFEQDFAELMAAFAAGEREYSKDVSLRFEENTLDLIQLLLRHPDMGRLRRDLKPEGIRSFRVRGFERYLLFYRVQGEDLVLLRLRFGGMDINALFRP